ncbi:MAG: type III-A CRISPR-associated RAMP protein Csm3 [Thermoplasmatales archaeon]
MERSERMGELFEKNIVMNLEIEILTGLHIGGSSDGLKIGGSDSPVITTDTEYEGHKISVPYIPGSSIKGKMRNLLLTVYGVREKDRIKFNPEHEDLDRIFGLPAEEGGKSGEIGRTRLIVRDALPAEDSIKSIMESSGTFFEVKGENTINPVTGKATPRFMDRVVPGLRFKGEIVIQIFRGDQEKKFLNYIQEGLDLINDSYLGGQGSRGYGKVKIRTLSTTHKELKDYVKSAQDMVAQA